MRGSSKGQAWAIMERSGIFQLGSSKGAAKESAREELQEGGERACSSAVASATGIYSVGTAQQYASTWTQLLEYAKAEYGEKNIENLTGEHVSAYLDYKNELGLDRQSLEREAAAIGKLEAALGRWNGRTDYDLKAGVESVRETIREAPERALDNRAYSDPQSIIKSLPANEIGLAGKIIYESGVRISEATNIYASQVKNLTTDPHTGKEIGQFSYVGKGGKIGTASISAETFKELKAAIASHGKFEVKQSELRTALQTSAGKEYVGKGAHGLRWNHAQERFQELQAHGVSRDVALSIVSQELNHERPEITEHYLAHK